MLLKEETAENIMKLKEEEEKIKQNKLNTFVSFPLFCFLESRYCYSSLRPERRTLLVKSDLCCL
jgi:hypothetical protein